MLFIAPFIVLKILILGLDYTMDHGVGSWKLAFSRRRLIGLSRNAAL